MFTTPPPYQASSPPSIEDAPFLIPIISTIASFGILMATCCLAHGLINFCINGNRRPSGNSVAVAEIVFANTEQNNDDLIPLSRDSLTGRVFGGSTGGDIPTIIAPNTFEPLTNLVRPAPSIPTNGQILTGVVVE
jgi:hypothetical protein